MSIRKMLLFAVIILGGLLAFLSSLRCFLVYVCILAALELLSYCLINFLRKKFQWLITSRDEFPAIDEKGLDKFMEHGFDPQLGWIRKPNTSKDEIGKYGKTAYSIGPDGSRSNPGHQGLPRKISLYGDSFIFGRQVNDNQTIQWYLSGYTKTNVSNFGVGNYGIDQALLRLKREFKKNKAEIVIIGVVPSTIVRILSVWKHYNEYGNTFGFKPRYYLEDNKLGLSRNIITDRAKFLNYRKYIGKIRLNDYFYESKFKKEMLTSPYLISILENPRRNLPLLFSVAKDRIVGQKKEVPYPKPMEHIMRINLELRYDLYKNPMAVLLFERILDEFILFSRKKKFKPVFLLMPQKDDVAFIKETGDFFYKDFVKKVSGKLTTIDVTDDLLSYGEKELDKIYSDDNKYGGHFSRHGSKIVAKIIYDRLKEGKII